MPATCTSAWVSTPPVTSRACPASAIVSMSSPFFAKGLGWHRRAGTGGQSTSGTTEVQDGLRGEVTRPDGCGPFPRSLPPNPAGTFQCTGLSSDLCRVRDGVCVDVVMAYCADDERLAPHPRHEGRPRWLARPGLAEVREPGDVVNSHRGAVLA